MAIYLSWNCDFCGKPCLTVSMAGVIYCENCRMSYGESIFGIRWKWRRAGMMVKVSGEKNGL
jgi:hypothetical protein